MYNRVARRKQKGLLILTIGFIALIFFLMLATLAIVEHSRYAVTLHKQKTAASYMAESGIEYARYMIRENRWSGRDRCDFTSPVIEGSGYFRIRAERSGYGYHIVSTGYATDKISVQITENI